MNFDSDSPPSLREIRGIPAMGTRMELQTVVHKHQVEEILVAIPSANRRMLTKILQDSRGTEISVQILSRTKKLASVASS